jgi:hypothetical protein
MSFAKEVWMYLRVRKKLWLLPILLALGIFGIVMFAAQSSVLAPFIYTLF